MIQISPDELQQLPFCHRHTIPEAYRDAMGHMNMRYYMAIYDAAAWKLFELFGLTSTYYRESNAGGFALEHHVHYYAEVHIGETVAVYGRVLGYSAKRVHTMMLMLNEDTGRLASTLEEVGSHADLILRRTSPFPPQIAERIGRLYQAHEQLDWRAPVCGVMGA
jgi:acyl-CoA thioester hydrolase